jgi:predicted nucleic acid-binding protein
MKLASVAAVYVAVAEEHYVRAAELVKLGLQPLDSLHVACAEAGGCDVVLSTDDQLLKRAARCGAALRVRVRNPLEWLLEQSE